MCFISQSLFYFFVFMLLSMFWFQVQLADKRQTNKQTCPTGPMLLLVSDCVCPAADAITPLRGVAISLDAISLTTGLGDIIHAPPQLLSNPFLRLVQIQLGLICFFVFRGSLWTWTWQLSVCCELDQVSSWQFTQREWYFHGSHLFTATSFPENLFSAARKILKRNGRLGSTGSLGQLLTVHCVIFSRRHPPAVRHNQFLMQRRLFGSAQRRSYLLISGTLKSRGNWKEHKYNLKLRLNVF